MSELHTKGRITFKEDGEANHYSMLTEDGRWWLAVLANGEQTNERQIANFRRLAACWNRLEPFTTEQIEDPGFDLAGTAEWIEREQYLYRRARGMKLQRDRLLAALEALIDMDVAYQRGPKVEQAVEDARAAIASVKGGA